MVTLVQQRCLNHAGREAAARCPGCGQFFCRECVTEHDGRILCTACLKSQTGQTGQSRRNWSRFGRVMAAGLGLLLAWMCFYSVGRVLLAIPSTFHEGKFWNSGVFDE